MSGRDGRRPRRHARGEVHAERRDVVDPEHLVYGRHPLREVIRGPRSVRRLHLTEEAQRGLAADLPSGAPIVIHDTAALSALTGTTDHQGCAAEVDGFAYCSIDDLLEKAGQQERAPFVVCLDQVTDPHNLGAIARVCDAAGADGILIPEHRSARVTGAVCKASAGAIEHVKVARCTNLADTLDRVRSGTIWAYGASAHGAVRYTDPDYTDGVLLVLGSEGAGIRPRVERMCDQLVSVPMAGAVASLNVSTVAALLAFEVVRQRG